MSSSLYNAPGAQFAVIVYDDNVKQCRRYLVNTLEIYENLFQHGVHVEVTGQLADTPTRGLQIADWTSRGLDNSRSRRCRQKNENEAGKLAGGIRELAIRELSSNPRILPIPHDIGSIIWKNTTSSTKPEVHNVVHCRQKRIDSRPMITCTENFVNYGHVVFDIRKGDIQTDRHAHRNTSNPYRQRNQKTRFSIVIRSMLN